MKLMLGGTPVKKMMIHNDTMDATIVASDMQAGKTAYANGQKVIGTGKSFEFAFYGKIKSNISAIIPNNVNVIQVTSMDYPVQSAVTITDIKNLDLSTSKIISNIIVDGVSYPVSVVIQNNMLIFNCDKSVWFQVFYGKDNYV